VEPSEGGSPRGTPERLRGRAGGSRHLTRGPTHRQLFRLAAVEVARDRARCRHSLTRSFEFMYLWNVMKSARAYESPLRADLMEQTRLRILEALTELVADPAVWEVTIPLVARRARVSLRTVYRHFPTRDALFDAWGEWVEKTLDLRLHTYPEDANDLVGFVPRLYEAYERNQAMMRALLGSAAARAARERTRRRRKRSFERSMRPLTAQLDTADRIRALAVVYLLASAPAWQAMREQWGLDGAEAGNAAAWAVRVLIDELRRNPNSIRDYKEVRP